MTVNPNDGPAQAVINVTPMIDILLVLLIVFMAIAPVRSSGFDAVVPRRASTQPLSEPEDPVVLEISSAGTLRINARIVAEGALPDFLIDVFRHRAERPSTTLR